MTQSIRIAALTTLALFVSAAAAPAVVIRCGNAASFPGGTAVVSVSLEHGEEEVVAGTQNDLVYDSAVFSINIAAGDCVINPAIGPGSPANKDINGAQIDDDTIRNIIVSLTTANPIPSGDLYTCAFHVADDAPLDEYTLTNTQLVASSPDGTRLPVTGTDCVIVVGPTPTATPRCRENSDCPDGQVCIDGECVTATPTATATRTAASTATATPRCRENSDCPDGQVCVDGECVTATPTRTQTATVTATATATPMCRENSDCPDGQVCIDGTCVNATPTATPSPVPTTKKKKGGGGGCSCEIDPGAGAGPRAADVLAVVLPALVLVLRWRSRRAAR